METSADTDIPLFWAATPTGGRLCIRQTGGGQATVGVLHLPSDVHINPERGYLLTHVNGKLRLARLPVADPLDERYDAHGIGDLLTLPVWPDTKHPDAMVVRFVEALPEQNAWTVFGPNRHPGDDGAPIHQWLDIDGGGQTSAIDPPFDGTGMGFSQLLTRYPVWPGPDGEMYSLPQMRPEWRAHMHRMHQLMVASTKDSELAAELRSTIQKDPHLRQLHIGSVDPDYCRYLAALDAAGGLNVDGPKTAEDTFKHEKIVNRCFAEIMGLGLEFDNMEPVRPKAPGRR